MSAILPCSGLRFFLAVVALLPVCGWADPKAEKADFSSMSLKDLLALEVFTSASLLPTQESKAPGTVYSFSSRDFRRFGARRLEDLLQFIPGIQLNQYRKRHQTAWARGLLSRYNDKLLLIVDGVRMQHLYYSHFALGDNLPLENIARVEIILGPASSLYGANAFGGIISVTTRNFSDTPQFEASVEAGNHQRSKATATYNSRTLQLFGSTLSQDAPFDGERRSFIGGAAPQPLDEDYTSLFVKARPLAGLTLALNYSENNTPFLFIPDTQDAFIEERMLTTSASYEAGTIAAGRIEARLFYTSDKTHEYEIERQSRALAYSENQHATIAGGTVTGLRQFANHVVALGSSWQYEEAEDMAYRRLFSFRNGFFETPEQGSLLRDANIRNNDYALFVQDVWTLTPSVELTLGARYDDFDQFGRHLNYRSALVYSPTSNQTWKVLYGTAMRTPGFREYLKVLEGTDYSPPTPEPEEIKSLELGYLYQWEDANLSIGLFRNKVTDFIQEMPTPDGIDEYFTNLDGSWHLRGVESVLNLRLAEKLNLRLGASFLDIEGSTSQPTPYLADWTGSINVDYSISASDSLGLSLIYNNNRHDTNQFRNDQAEAFVIANVFLAGEFNRNFSYAAGIDNVFNTRVFDPAADFGNQHNTERPVREIWLRLMWSYGN